MGLGVSLILIAVGLVLALAVHASVGAVDVQTVGWILTVVGGVGFLVSLVLWDRLWPRDRDRGW
jgi:hypothetical protein